MFVFLCFRDCESDSEAVYKKDYRDREKVCRGRESACRGRESHCRGLRGLAEAVRVTEEAVRMLLEAVSVMSGRAPPANGPDGGSGGTWFVELAGRGGRLPADNIGIGIYGGEGCRGKRKVVCYPAGGGTGKRCCCPCLPPPADYPRVGGWERDLND